MAVNILLSILLFAITFIIYLISDFNQKTPYNYFVLLADAFLHGRLDVLSNPSWLNELVNWKGRFYVVYPPMPAVLLIPFVAIFGISFPQQYLSVFLGAVNVALAYLVMLKIFNKKDIAIWVSILYAFGTIQWFHAAVGSSWYVAHIVAATFLWLVILESITKKRLFVIGLFLGAVYLSRIPAIMALIFVFIFLREKFIIFEDKKYKVFPKSAVLLLGFLPLILLNFGYNFIRYGTVSDLGYVLLPVFNEPWYKYGFVSIKYIPTHLTEMFFALPKFILKPPYVIPNLFAMSILLITPAYFLIIFTKFKERINFAALAAVILTAIPELMHGGNGFSQFGYRHTLDFIPFLLLLTASGFNIKYKWWAKALIIISILVNLWGVIMINYLNKWVI